MNKNPHQPIRTCILCRKKLIKEVLHRFVLKEEEIHFDPKKILPGRGVYLCDECLAKKDELKAKSRFIKALKGKLKK